jgi:serine/threonine-protein kinase
MASPVETGQILAGKYRVDKVLGEGGMGIVVAATDLQLERQVAIKFLLPEFAHHPEASPRFMREARAAVKIQSEHIARVIDVNTMENGSPYMVMEYLHGSDLAHVLDDRGQLPMEEAVLFVIEACDAIAEAHSYGIVHRDLKPANLFLAKMPDESHRIKVLDFGISKSVIAGGSTIDQSLTRTSSMMGSPLYMSPEQIKSTRDVDQRTDVWALGVILYELLTGNLPFSGKSIPELSAQILLEPPLPLSHYRPDLPQELGDVLVMALQKDLNKRYPSTSEFAIDLLHFAPRKARANVERITRLLHQAGISQSIMPAPSSRGAETMGPSLSSLPRASASKLPAPPGIGGALEGVDTGILGSRPVSAQGRNSTGIRVEGAMARSGPTVTEFTKTPGPHPTTRFSSRSLAVAGLVLAVLIGGLALALLSGGDDVSAEATTQDEAALAAAPEPRPAAPAQPEPPSAAVQAAETRDEPEPAVRPVPPEPPAAIEPTPAPKPRPKPVVKAPAPRPAQPAATGPAGPATAPAASADTSGGFKSKYGGRK